MGTLNKCIYVLIQFVIRKMRFSHYSQNQVLGEHDFDGLSIARANALIFKSILNSLKLLGERGLDVCQPWELFKKPCGDNTEAAQKDHGAYQHQQDA